MQPAIFCGGRRLPDPAGYLMSCPYEYLLEFSDASGCHGPKCHDCSELCEHNSRYDFETDSLTYEDLFDEEIF